MYFKLIVAFVDDDNTDAVMKAARDAGATGATVIGNAHGEGLQPPIPGTITSEACGFAPVPSETRPQRLIS